MKESTKGALVMLAAFSIWGLSPLYYVQLKHVPPLEILSYRALCSLAFFVIVLAVQGRLAVVFAVLTNPRNVAIIAVAAIMISANWFGFIFSVTNGLALEASLGYYIFPLLAVLLGRFAFTELLSGLQAVAVGLAFLAVLVLAVGLGVPPWIALGLAGTFAIYGTIKKTLDVGPVVSVTAEVLLVAPFAAIWLITNGNPDATAYPWSTYALLVISGPLTALPLVMFSYGAKRARMSTIGFIQYLNPTLQLSCAVYVFAEPFTKWHAIAFPMIWVALTLYSVASVRQDKAARRLA